MDCYWANQPSGNKGDLIVNGRTTQSGARYPGADRLQLPNTSAIAIPPQRMRLYGLVVRVDPMHWVPRGTRAPTMWRQVRA